MALAELAHGGLDHRIPLGQQELGRIEGFGRAESPQVESRRRPVRPGEVLEQRSPGVGAVGVAMDQQQWRPFAVDLDLTGVDTGQRSPALASGYRR